MDALNAAAAPLPDTDSDTLRKAVDNLMRALGRVLIEVEQRRIPLQARASAQPARPEFQRSSPAAERASNPHIGSQSSANTERLEQARRHRMRAEEYRCVAEQMQDPTARATYLRLADAYKTLAKRLESNAENVNPSLRLVP